MNYRNPLRVRTARRKRAFVRELISKMYWKAGHRYSSCNPKNIAYLTTTQIMDDLNAAFHNEISMYYDEDAYEDERNFVLSLKFLGSQLTALQFDRIAFQYRYRWKVEYQESYIRFGTKKGKRDADKYMESNA